MIGIFIIVGLVTTSIWVSYVLAQQRDTKLGATGPDWPTYMHDNARSGVTTATVDLPLAEQWVYKAPAPPQPAWTDPQDAVVEGIHEQPRMKFDDAFHVAVVDNAVYFGSSVDNKVYALDVTTGKVRWTFFTEGPVRLAPTVHDGWVYVGSDDGYVYCLSAVDGRLIWKFRGAPSEQRILGSGKMISLWPVRTSVLVDENVAYFGAGVFPGERVYMYAVSAKDGTLIWKNDTVSDQKAGQFDFSPQGYLLASGRYLFATSGRSLPACFDRKDGQFLFKVGGGGLGRQGSTGTYTLLTDDLLYSGTQNTLLAYWQRKPEKTGFAWSPARRLVVTPDVSYVLNGGAIRAIDRIAYEQKEEKDAAALAACTKWRYERRGLHAMIVAGKLLFAGGENEVVAIDKASGQELWKGKVSGRAKGLAAASGRLLVSTDKGNIYCFGKGRPVPATVAKVASNPYPRDELTALYKKAATTIVRETGIKKGYCLVLGCSTGRLAYELAKRTDLMIYGIEPDAKKVEQARKALDAAGEYGTRVCVDHGELDSLPYSDYFANLVVSEEAIVSGQLPASAEEVFRVLKPCGGVLFIGQPSPAAKIAQPLNEERLRKWLASGGIDKNWELIRRRGTWAKLVRGPLEGAGCWTHQYGDPGNTASSNDQLVKCPLGVLWYGDPGANKVPSRHLRNVAPLSINGRVFLQGVNMREDKELVMCFDAYNGVMYWQREIPGAYRVHTAVDCSNLACTKDSLFVATGAKCLRLDAATGRTKATYKVPPAEDGSEHQWAYVAVADGLLFGSTYNGPEYSDSVFAVDTETGQRLWLHQGQKIRNNTIAVSDGRIFFADDRATDEQRRQAVKEREEHSEPHPESLKGNKSSDEMTAEQEPANANVWVVFALDAATGKKIWEKPVDLTGCGDERIAWSQDNPNPTNCTLSAICKNDVLLFCAALCNGHYWRQFLSGEFAGRTAVALSAQNGSLLWSKAIGYRIRPLVIGDTIYAEPWAFDLHTGEQKTRIHPLTGKPTVWEFERPGHHCGAISGCPNALFFRSYFTAYYDLISDQGTSHFAGHRPGCWINIIPANGLVLEPEASSGCVCQYSLQSTVVFQPREPNKAWGIFASRGQMSPINHLAINLGGPGDRRDRHGTLWLGYPRPGGRMRLDLALDVTTLPGHGYFNHAAEHCPIAGTDTPWLYSCGCSGLTNLTIPLIGEEEAAAVYTVRLGFADIENGRTSRRIFDIKLQDKVVEKNFDIIRAVGGPNRAGVREFEGIEVRDNLKIELVPKAGRPTKAQVPILNSIEIVREGS